MAGSSTYSFEQKRGAEKKLPLAQEPLPGSLHENSALIDALRSPLVTVFLRLEKSLPRRFPAVLLLFEKSLDLEQVLQ
jgi:hypothetical protein